MRAKRGQFGLAHLKGVRRPRTPKGWLTTVAIVALSVAVKLTIGASVILFLVHHLTR